MDALTKEKITMDILGYEGYVEAAFKSCDGEVFQEESTAQCHEQVVQVIRLFEQKQLKVEDILPLLAELRRYDTGELDH